MKKLTSATTRRGSQGGRLGQLAIAALAAGALGASVVMVAASAASTTIESVNVPQFAGALANHSSRSLYILTSEKGAKLKCTGSCLSSWLPLEVSAATKTIHLGMGVTGKIGFVARSKSEKQVTFNSYPLYTFVGDSAARQSHGQGIKDGSGTWTLVHANAKTPGETSFTSSAPSTPTPTPTPAPPTTTTTTPGGGGGVAY